MNSATPIDAGRLQAFLDAAGPLLRAKALAAGRAADRPALSPARLQACVATLGPPLAAARRAGAFANPWTVAGLRRDEVRTAAVLAWLLNPSGSHGGGDAYARALWRRVMGGKPPFELTGLRTATTEQCPLGDEFNRVDVVLEGDGERKGDGFLVFIEVKIDAPLREQQLEDYAAALARKAVHLNKRSKLLLLAIARPDIPDGCIAFNWRDTARAIREAAGPLRAAGHDCRLALSFADHIERLHG